MDLTRITLVIYTALTLGSSESQESKKTYSGSDKDRFCSLAWKKKHRSTQNVAIRLGFRNSSHIVIVQFLLAFMLRSNSHF